ncbi:hypothetical protein COCNU_scaffold122756G000010 [Cocos nucifera]|nr:hypothetical protein [Cocos nucifera]
MTIFVNTIRAIRLQLAKVREKAEASYKVAKAKIGFLKESLGKVEAKKVKVEADGATERKRRKAAETKVIEAKKMAQDQVIEAERLAVEAFKASPKFTKIKVEFGVEAFEAEQELCE